MFINRNNRDSRQSDAVSVYIFEKSNQILKIHKSGRITLFGV